LNRSSVPLSAKDTIMARILAAPLRLDEYIGPRYTLPVALSAGWRPFHREPYTPEPAAWYRSIARRGAALRRRLVAIRCGGS
jgi:hypothetical protein